MKKENFIQITLIFLFLIGVISTFAFSDTGTYRILDYTVTLTPHSDGTVEIEYYQKWLVTGGHIPWITVGTANSSYYIDQNKNGGNIRSIYDYNSSGWTGVRIDLDKDYLPDETFEVDFTMIQSQLFYADEDNYKLDFTPGWYDSAVTERLVVTMHIFAPIDQVRAIPRPTSIEDQEIIWESFNVGKGGKFFVSISFPKSHMPEVNPDVLKSLVEIKRTSGWPGLIFALVIIFIIIVLIFMAKTSPYEKGGSVSAAGTGGRGGRSTGGGGGLGGRSSSCACACVSCACACACAGGGGAGCSKKSYHSCSVCESEKFMS
jgi:hypothetical protein